EGHGRLMASVHIGLGELALRIRAEEPDLFGKLVKAPLKQDRKRLIFRLDPDLWDAQEDIRNVEPKLLWDSQDVLREVLGRLAVSGWKTRALLPEELAYLQNCV